jgi:uncharacterized protein
VSEPVDARTLAPATVAAVLADGPTPLFATLSGAHLYGFASVDADVDLRGAFVKPLADRLTLRDTADTVTVERRHLGLEVDWVAHDVRKFARRLLEHIGYVLEQLYSPLVVADGGGWLRRLREVSVGCIVAGLHHHYRGFAASKRRDLERPGATVKDLLYAYRVLLTGIRVLRTGRVEAHLPTLLEQHVLPEPGQVGELIDRKRDGREKGALGPGDDRHGPMLDDLGHELDTAAAICRLPPRPSTDTVAALDELVTAACLELG